MDSVPYSRRNCITWTVASLLMLLASCATVNHGPELAAADQAMSLATGVKTSWAALPDTRYLALDENGTLPLDSVVEFALANNRALRADLEVLGQAKADWVQAGLLSNPILSVMTGLPEGGGRADVAFGLSKDFADLWLIPIRKRTAQAMVQQRVLSFTDTAISLLNECKTTYYGLQYQVMAGELQEQNLRILQESMEIAQARLRAGDTTQLDVNLVRARYLEAQNELLQLLADAAMSRRTILRLMGFSKMPAEWSPDPLVMNTASPEISANEAELVEVALLQRLDVQQRDGNSKRQSPNMTSSGIVSSPV